MFLYPSLAIGFLFVGVPLLVHLINLLRHRRTQWAAMDFLLASYRKQRKWIVLRQMLLLLTRLAVAGLLIALLAGMIGGKRLIGAIGGQTSHHVIVLDDSYSMRQTAGRSSSTAGADNARPTARESGDVTAYDRALSAVSTLVRRLAGDEGDHQITVLRASRASMVADTENASADMVADLAAQSVAGDTSLLDRVMSTRASSLRADLVPAIDLASRLLATTSADDSTLYVISDFTRRDWNSPKRLAQSLTQASETDAKIKMIDCMGSQSNDVRRNLAITELSPVPDVWVAGVPVMMNVTVKNYSAREVKNLAIATSVITYSTDLMLADPTATVSGTVQALPAVMIDSIPGGQQLTKSFQIFIDQEGTHVVRCELPEDALAIDNTRVSTVPLADAQRVLVIDGDTEAMGAYHVSSVLDPGSQVRIGAIPETQSPAMLRDASLDSLKRYRAIYLIDVPEIGERAAEVLRQYVSQGGGLAFFLGDGVSADSYNTNLYQNAASDQNTASLLPFPLGGVVSAGALDGANVGGSENTESRNSSPASLQLGENAELLGPITQAGNSIFGLVNLQKAWQPAATLVDEFSGSIDRESGLQVKFETILQRGNEDPLAVLHSLGQGRVVTVMTGLDGKWNNWAGDPTFVVFLLQTNAMLFSGASPPTSRLVDTPTELSLPGDRFISTVTVLPPASEPPRLAIELKADDQDAMISISPQDLVISPQSGLDELLSPGVLEWQMTQTDGRTRVLPVASVLRVGESDLARADSAEIIRDLLPLEVQFMSASDWDSRDSIGGMSAFLMVLLGLLAVLIAVEQALASWASYHSAPRNRESSIGRKSSTRHQPVGPKSRIRRTRQAVASSDEEVEA